MSSGPVETSAATSACGSGCGPRLFSRLGCIGLLALAYYVLAAAVGSKDREVLEARLREFAAVYDNGGLPGLRSVTPAGGRVKRPFMCGWSAPGTMWRSSACRTIG